MIFLVLIMSFFLQLFAGTICGRVRFRFL